jgi:predicted outer membrane repeat protein
MNITSSSVDHNRAHRHGGAIYAGTDAEDATVHSSLMVYNTTLDNNVAEANGGERSRYLYMGALGQWRSAYLHFGCSRNNRLQEPGW